MIRDDLSTKLVHLIRGDTFDQAFLKFENILRERRLRGGTGFIRGGFNCVCFTESPIGKLGYVLADPERRNMRYRPMGIMLDKTWVFERGGRPVIYQPDADYERLPAELRYRHVIFDPPIDFTWEREWRIRIDELPLPIESATVVVPNRYWRDVLVENHAEEIRARVLAQGHDAAAHVAPYPYHVIVLDDLGIPIPDGLVNAAPEAA